MSSSKLKVSACRLGTIIHEELAREAWGDVDPEWFRDPQGASVGPEDGGGMLELLERVARRIDLEHARDADAIVLVLRARVTEAEKAMGEAVKLGDGAPRTIAKARSRLDEAAACLKAALRARPVKLAKADLDVVDAALLGPDHKKITWNRCGACGAAYGNCPRTDGSGLG